MYTELWAQCPLCSHNRQSLFPVCTALCTRVAQITSCDVTLAQAVRPSIAELPCGSQPVTSPRELRHCLTFISWKHSLLTKTLCDVLFTNCPHAFIKSGMLGPQAVFPAPDRYREVWGTWAHDTVTFTSTNTGATLYSSHFLVLLHTVCLRDF